MAGGYRGRGAAVNEQERLITDELESLLAVAEKGFVSKARIRALERAKADLIGQRGRLRAARDSAANMVGEARLKALEAITCGKSASAAGPLHAPLRSISSSE